MEEHRSTELVNEIKKHPHTYLLSTPATDLRWRRVMHFWNLPANDINRIPFVRLRKQRSKQVLIAIMDGRYCKSNIEIIVNHQDRVITFRYRGTVIGKFHHKIMTFLPVHADLYEGTFSTVGQRKSAKSAIQEVIRAFLGDSAAERLSLAYKEFLELLFGTVPRQPSDYWVSREAYVQAMKVIEEKYNLEAGDEDFLEWRLTILGRSPRLIDDKTMEGI